MISIIIPIYNTEKFLQKCLESISSQTFVDFEVLLIDDGSTDSSAKICKRYAEKDSRFKYFYKNNGGVSSARNLGLKKSSGDYITFIDADDFVSIDYLKNAAADIKKNDADILKYPYVKKLKKISKKYNFTYPKNILIQSRDYKELIYPFILSSNDLCNVCGSFYKKEIAKTTNFDKDITIGEDYLFAIEALQKSKSIYFSKKHTYYYVVNSNSATHKNTKEQRNILLKTISVFDKIKDTIKIARVYNFKLNNEIYYYAMNFVKNNSYKLYKDEMTILKNTEQLANRKDLTKKSIKILNGSRAKYITFKMKTTLKNFVIGIFK